MITLRALEPNDVALLYAVENDASMWYLSPTTAPYSRQFLEQYIMQTTGDIYTDKQLRLVIEDGETHEPLGLVDLQGFEPKHLRAEVGIVVLPEHRGKGVAAEALRLLHAYAASTLRMHQLFAVVPVKNIPSIRLFQSAGYERQMVMKDWIYDGADYQDCCFLQVFL